MTLRNLSRQTQQSYIYAVAKFGYADRGGAGGQADPLRRHEMTEMEIVIAPAGGQRQADVFTAHWGDILLATSRLVSRVSLPTTLSFVKSLLADERPEIFF
jgi:hypothetical protein